jgi:hypothetical protein
MHNWALRLGAACLVAFLSAALTLTASERWPQVPSGQGTDPVTVEFRAFTAGGRPVLDLSQEDVWLKVDGRARQVVSFALTQLPPPRDRSAAAIPPPFGTNTATDGRDILIMIDDESVPPGGEARYRVPLTQFIEKLSEVDRVGFRTPRGSVGVWPTLQHDAVISVVNATVGRAPATETSEDAICRTRLVLDALKAALTDISGQQRPMLVFVSRRMSAAPPEGGATRMKTPVGVCELRWQDIDEVGNAAKNSNIEFYVAQLAEDYASGDAENNDAIVGLETLAGVSGHTLTKLRGDTTVPMTRLATETAVTYLVAFEPEPGERNGGSHKVEVAVQRPGVKVDFWPRMMIAKPGRSPSKSTRDMLRLSVAERDLGLRAAAYASRGQDPAKVQVLALFEPVLRSVKLASAMVALLDANGQVVVQSNIQSGLNERPIRCALPVRPGTYLLRVAAIDANGRAGTVDYEVHASLTAADPVKLSAMVLGATDKGSLVPRLEFSSETVAVAHFEVYGAAKGQTVSAVLEMTESPDGPAVATVTAKVSDPEKDVHRVYGSIPLPPMSGQILIRAIVSIDGKPVGKLFRTLSKNVE